MSGVGGRARHSKLAVAPLRPVQMQVLLRLLRLSDRCVRTRFVVRSYMQLATSNTLAIPMHKSTSQVSPGGSLGAAILAEPVFDLLRLVT